VAVSPERNAQDVGQHILCFLFVSGLTFSWSGVERTTSATSTSGCMWFRFVRLSQKARLQIKKSCDKLQQVRVILGIPATDHLTFRKAVRSVFQD